MSRFEVGEKVIIRTYPKRPSQWSDKMFELMGKTVTIRRNFSDPFWPYSIEEHPRWVWREEDFLSITNKKDPNYLFMCRRK